MGIEHFLPLLLLVLDLFFKLFLYFFKDSLSILLAFSRGLHNLLKNGVELISEIEKIFSDLGLLVEGEVSLSLRMVVDDGMDKILSVAVSEENLNFGN